MKNKFTLFLTTLALSLLFTIPTFAVNTVNVTFVTPNGLIVKTVPQGTDMTYLGPTDINVKGFAFCGWSVPLKNVQTDTVAWAVYLPIGSESQMVQASQKYHNLPTGVLSYSTANQNTLQLSKEALSVSQTPINFPCTLTAQQTVQLNPVGVPGKTCVVKWYNGSNSELWRTDVVTYGTTLPAPATPCIPGLEFVGWDGSWTNITSDRNIIACYYKNYHVHFNCSVDGDSFDEKLVRQSDFSKSCADDISLSSHNHGEVDHWDYKIQDNGIDVIMTVYFK